MYVSYTLILLHTWYSNVLYHCKLMMERSFQCAMIASTDVLQNNDIASYDNLKLMKYRKNMKQSKVELHLKSFNLCMTAKQEIILRYIQGFKEKYYFIPLQATRG